MKTLKFHDHVPFAIRLVHLLNPAWRAGAPADIARPGLGRCSVKTPRPAALRFALLAVLALFTGPAGAQILLVDPPSTIISGTTNDISASATVSSGANVLVVLLADKGQYAAPETLSYGSQTLTRAATAMSTASTYREASVYYLFNPTPGTAQITGTPAAPATQWSVQYYTLSGVDTNVAPVGDGAGGGSGAAFLTVELATPDHALAAVCADWSQSLSTITISNTAGVGTANTTTVYPDGTGSTASSIAMGYISNCTPAGTYTYKATSSAPNKSAFAVALFTPIFYATPPLVTSPTKAAVGASGATLGATVVSDGGTPVTDYGIVWGTSTNPTTANNKVRAGTSVTPPSTYTVNVTGLPLRTVVYYRGYAINAKGTSYSGGDWFSTTAAEPTTSASGVTFPDVRDTGMVVSWTRGNGSNCIVLARAGSPVDAAPVDSTAYTANSVLGSGSEVGTGNFVVYAGSGNSFTLRGLATGNPYYVAVYEYNGFGGGENYRTTSPATGTRTTVAHVSGTTYYSVPTLGAPQSVYTWSTETNGTGFNPPDFTSGDTFIIQSGHTLTPTNETTMTWEVSAATGGTSATLQINSGAKLWLDTGLVSFSLRLGGNLIHNGTFENISARGSGITFMSDGSWTGSGDFSTGTQKINVTVNAGVTLNARNMTTGFKMRSGNTVYIRVFGTLDMGTNTINGNNNGSATFVVWDGATLITAHPGGVGIITNTTAAGALFNYPNPLNVTLSTLANFVFNGTEAQVTSISLPATVNNLTLSNSAGVTLSQPVTVSGILALDAGTLITTPASVLTIDQAGSLSVGSASAYVSGPLVQTYTATGPKAFPIGLNGSYRPVAVNLTTLSGTPAITVTPNEPTVFGGTPPAGKTVWQTRNWTITCSEASGNVADITLDGTDYPGGASASLLQWNGTTTIERTPTFSSPNYSVSGINLTASSDLALTCLSPATPAISSVSAPSCSPVSVSWGTVSGGVSYNVYRKLSGGSYGAALATGLTTTSYSDDAVNRDGAHSYVYAVTVISTCGAESAKSADSSPVTPTGSPAAPVISSVTAGCESLTVNWGAVDGASNGYKIYRKLSGGEYGASPIASVAGGTLSYPDSAANDSTKTYVYAVTAVGACESVKSADSTGTRPNGVGFATDLANAAAYEGFPVTLSVAAVNATSYKWQVNKGGGFVDAVEGVDGTGSTAANFTTASVSSGMSGYQYRCVVTGSCNSRTSSVATMSLGTRFRSVTIGYWTDSNVWQLSSDGVSWSSVPSGVYPGAIAGHADSVQVRAEHTVTVAGGTTNVVGDLTIDAGSTAGGTVVISEGTNTAVLQIAGNLVINTGIVNGKITAPIGAPGTPTYMVEFTGNSTWSGSGNISEARVRMRVATGATLTLACNLTLNADTSATLISVDGRLNAGTRTIIQPAGSKFCVMNINSEATVETANAGGLGGRVASSGTFQGGGTLSFSPTASYIFDGAVNQSALGIGSVSLFSGATNLTIQNTGGAGNNMVTVGSVVIGGTLHIQSGLLSFGSDNSSTAGLLTFDGSTYQAPGTWGSSSSGSAHQDNAHFAGTGYVTVLGGQTTPLPTESLAISGTSLTYSGGVGTQFVLLSSTNLANELSSWDRVATNYVTPGTFTIPPAGSSPKMFYSITSE